ncbi:MAG: extradiol dioxygenase family protein [Hyphomicrobiaceae bacterium]|jgi:extradiol dioxygenase family protein
MIADLDHIVLAVGDVDASLAFYIEVIGLEPYRVSDWRAGRVIFPSVRLNPATIIDLLPPQYWAESGEDAEEIEMTIRQPNLNHFCLTVAGEDWQPLLDRLAIAGIAFDSGPMILHGARGDAEAYYLQDPDGIQLELRHYT